MLLNKLNGKSKTIFKNLNTYVCELINYSLKPKIYALNDLYDNMIYSCNKNDPKKKQIVHV